MTNHPPREQMEGISVLSGHFDGPVAAGGGEAVDLRGSQGVVYKPSLVYQIIQQRYPLLKDYVYDVDTDIERVTQWFVGRDFVFDWLEVQLRALPCGYLRLVADAGLGKTTIAAEIARRYGALVHFVNASEGVTHPDQCLKSLCAQLIARYGLPHDHLPERAGQDTNFLQTLLQEAAAKRGDAPVLLVIDALDEADPVAAGRNWLLLPNHLPEGVYVLLTHRPGDYTIAAAAQTRQPEPLVIAWDDPRQEGDIAAHLRRQAERPEISRALEEAAPPIAVEQFVSALQAAAEGNFMYLEYVLADIAAREPGFDPLDLQGLPRGLQGYYEHFWQQMQPGAEAQDAEWEAWEIRHLPILEGLGVAGEPVPARWLVEQTGLPKRTVRRILANWQRFLRCERREGDVSTWRIIHRSFADFLAEKEEVNLPEAHRRVAAWYLETWGGLKAGLPGLQEPEKWDLDGGYALRYLTSHLAAAEREADLWNLLVETPTWRKAQRLHDPSLRQYARDIELAVLLGERRGIDCVPQVVAYNLLYATTVSQVTSVPSEALALMTSLGQVELALRFAELTTSPERQAKAYIKIGEELLSQGNIADCVEVLARARIAAMLIAHPGNRGSALSKMAQVLDRAGRKETAQDILSHALESIASETCGIGEAVIDIAETAISMDDSDALSRLLPIAICNEEEGSSSRGRFFCRLAITLGKGGRRDELVRFLALNPLGRISESKAFTLAWIAFGLMLAGDRETAEGLFDQARSMAEHKDDYSPSLTVGDELELAFLAAMVRLGNMTDPSDVLFKATGLFDGRRQHTQYDDRREHITLYEDRQQHILDEVVQLMIQNGDLDGIRALAELPDLLEFRVELLSYYAYESAQLGESNEAEKALKRALQAINEFTERYYADWPNRVKKLRLVVDTMVQLGYSQCLEEALDVAERTQDYYGHTDYYARSLALAIVARALVRIGNNQRAQEVLLGVFQLPESTHATRSELRAWSGMMLALAGSGNTTMVKQAARKAMEIAETIGDCNYVIEELVAVAQGFTQIQDSQGLLNLLSCVRRIEIDDFARGEILIGIARAMAQIGDRLGLVDVITAAGSTVADDTSAWTLVGITHILAKTGYVDGLLHVVAAAQGISGYGNVLTTVGLALAQMGRFEIAEEVLSCVPWKEDISRDKLHWGAASPGYHLIIYNIAQALALTGRFDQALKLTEYMYTYNIPELDTEPDKEYLRAEDGHPSRDETYVAIAQAWLSQAESHSDQEEALRVAIETVARIERKTNRFYGLIVLSRSLAKTGKQSQAHKVLDTALQIAETFQDREEQIRAMIAAAEALVQIGEIHRACESLAKTEDLVRGIEDSKASVQALGLLAEGLVKAGEFSRAREVILDAVFRSMIVSGILERFGSDENIVAFHVHNLIWFADLHAQMDEISQTRELLSLASEATQHIQDEYSKACLLMRQAGVHFRIGDPAQAHQIVLSALEAFTNSRYSSATFVPGRRFLQDLSKPLVENIHQWSQEALASLLLSAFQHARSRGRDEVLEHIGILATVLSKLGVATETWERIQTVEDLVKNITEFGIS